MNAPVRRRAVAASLAILSLPSLARAQPLPSIDARTWRPSPDPSAGLVLEPTPTPGPWNWNVGGFLSYAAKPVSLAVDGSTITPVKDLLALDLVGSVGLGSRFAVGANLPLALYQDGTKPLPGSVSSSGTLPATALGDLAVSAKASLLDDTHGGFGLAAVLALTVPTGNPDSFMGEDAFTIGGRFLFEYSFLVAWVQASLGYTVKPDARTWPDARDGGITYGNTIPWSFAVALKPAFLNIDPGHRQRWELGAHGWVPGGPVAPFVGAGAALESPFLLSVSDRIEVGHYHDGFVLVGAQWGPAGPIGVPAFRGVVGIGFAPRAHDRDGDGVPDDLDRCLDQREDGLGERPHDGCPRTFVPEDETVDLTPR